MRGAAMPGNFRKPSSAGQYIGLGLSFGVTMLVNVAIAAMAGRWLDSKLGTPDIFWLLGVLIGICAGFRLFIEQVDQLQQQKDPNERE